MFDKSKRIKLTNRELDIMGALWAADDPMNAQDILNTLSDSDDGSKSNIKAIRNQLKILLEKGAIIVSNRSKTAKTTVNSYSPLITAEEYTAMQFTRYFQHKQGNSVSGIVAALLDNDSNEESTLDSLAELLAERKKRLLEGDDKQ